MLILIGNLSYSQYPIIKKIGEDSLVLITIKQGEEINQKFIENKNKIDSLEQSVLNKQNDILKMRNRYDSLFNIGYLNVKHDRDMWKTKYEERLRIPTKVKYHDDGWDFAQKLILIGIILVQFHTIGQSNH